MRSFSFVLVALVILLYNLAIVSASKVWLPFRGGGSSSASPRRTPQSSAHRNSAGRTSSSEEESSSSSSSIASGLSSLTAPGRRACNFYIWDAPSALLYRWCNHLLRDAVYEGRGGRKFVRIEPGSILQLLYPSSHNYSPDRCIFCGGSFPDHVALWWSKHLYTPFDLRVDQDFRYGRVVRPEVEETATKKQRGKKKKAPVTNPEDGIVDFLFHRRYITEEGQLINYAKTTKGGKRRRMQLLRNDNSREAALLRTDGALEKRKVYVGSKRLNYVVPAAKKASSLTLLSVRQITLNAVEALIRLERFERDTTAVAKRNIPVLN